jgi:hypothetical protein
MRRSVAGSVQVSPWVREVWRMRALWWSDRAWMFPSTRSHPATQEKLATETHTHKRWVLQFKQRWKHIGNVTMWNDYGRKHKTKPIFSTLDDKKNSIAQCSIVMCMNINDQMCYTCARVCNCVCVCRLCNASVVSHPAGRGQRSHSDIFPLDSQPHPSHCDPAPVHCSLTEKVKDW